MRQIPSALAPAGASPARLNPLSPAPVNDQGQRLTDLMAIQRLFANGEQGGYWPCDARYLFEDSAGTIPASRDGVVGLRVNYVTGKPNAVQATTANKPYLRRTPISNKFWLDSNTATGALTATFSGSLGSACTIASVGAEGVTIADNQTVGTTYNLCPPYGYNGDVLIINRALTSAENALVRRVMGRNVPMLGSELVTNGNFDTGTGGWAASGSANISWDASKSIVVDITGSLGGISQNITGRQSTNNQYFVKYDAYKNTFTGTSLRISLFNINIVYTIPDLTGVLKTFTAILTPSAASGDFIINRATSNTGTVVFDNISFKAIL